MKGQENDQMKKWRKRKSLFVWEFQAVVLMLYNNNFTTVLQCTACFLSNSSQGICRGRKFTEVEQCSRPVPPTSVALLLHNNASIFHKYITIAMHDCL